MKNLLAVILCFVIPLTVFAGDAGYKVNYDGGSISDVKAGTGMKLMIDSNQVRLVKDKTDVITIPASSITEISNGQDVHRRGGAAIGLAVVSFGIGAHGSHQVKEALHWIDVGRWRQKGRCFAMQCDKNDYRGVLAGLEGVTGKKAVDSDAMTVKN